MVEVLNLLDTHSRTRTGQLMPLTSPVLIVDIDGVLNAQTEHPNRRIWPDYRTSTIRRHGQVRTITWAPRVITWIADIHRNAFADVLLLTDWGPDSGAVLSDAIAPLPLLQSPGDTPRDTRSASVHRWKLVTVQQIDPCRPVLWVDSTLREAAAGTTREWIRDRPHLHTISPAMTTGMTPGQLATAQCWLAHHRRVHP